MTTTKKKPAPKKISLDDVIQKTEKNAASRIAKKCAAPKKAPSRKKAAKVKKPVAKAAVKPIVNRAPTKKAAVKKRAVKKVPAKRTPNGRQLVPAKKKAVKKSAKSVPKKKAAVRRKMGRPTSYRDEYAEKAHKLCLLGITDVDLADMFDIAVSTLYEWKKKVPDFSEALLAGKKFADAEVASSLFERAKGYTCDDIHVSQFGGKVIITNIKKHYPPDVAAAKLWLTNRQPDLWREKVDMNLGGQAENPLYILARAIQGHALPFVEE